MTSHRKIPCRGTAALGSNKNPDVFLFLAIVSHPQSLFLAIVSHPQSLVDDE